MEDVVHTFHVPKKNFRRCLFRGSLHTLSVHWVDKSDSWEVLGDEDQFWMIFTVVINSPKLFVCMVTLTVYIVQVAT